MIIRITLSLIFVIIRADAGIKSTWAKCQCRWEPWSSWSYCTKTCGGGIQQRDRRISVSKDCGHFSDCATDDMALDSTVCNAFCYNGGTILSYGCSCRDGWYGSCCQSVVNCGDPGTVENGEKHGTNFQYGQSVTYTCDANYNITSGSTEMECLKNGQWSGSKPTCTFVNTCQSNPCQNGGTCVNGYERYACICTNGFSGVNCENDIQPPIVQNCSKDQFVFSEEPVTKTVWEAPTFIDPLGNQLKVTTNYPKNEYDFPWGDFTVQYTALKPSNGLRTECSFNITVRPNPCKELNTPVNGYKVCTGWKKDYGRFCLQYCSENFTVERRYDLRQWHVCGISGEWSHPGFMPNCTDSETKSSPLHIPVGESTDDIKDKFLNTFKKSKFKYFCDKFKTDCLRQNVDIDFNI